MAAVRRFAGAGQAGQGTGCVVGPGLAHLIQQLGQGYRPLGLAWPKGFTGRQDSDCLDAKIVWRIRGEVQQPATYPQARLGMTTVCKTVGSAYDGSNPTPATPCENAPLAANSRASGALLLCPVMCHLVAL